MPLSLIQPSLFGQVRPLGQVREFILAVSRGHGQERTRSTVNAVRMFLRFLANYGHCSPDLVAAVPGIARWRLASLPRYISVADIERLIAVCDPNCAAGARDHAVILLLARLGLRAGDVRHLLLGDIDWSQGRIRVVEKAAVRAGYPFLRRFATPFGAISISPAEDQ